MIVKIQLIKVLVLKGYYNLLIILNKFTNWLDKVSHKHILNLTANSIMIARYDKNKINK